MSTHASGSIHDTATPARRPHAPLWLLALVSFSGTLAMHIFVPALRAQRQAAFAAA